MILSAAIAGLALAAGIAGSAGAWPASSPWPMFQGDPQHTGRSAYSGPSSPVLKWSFRLEGYPGSPAIGPDGTIYLPTGMLGQDTVGYLYAINPNGTQKWRYRFAGLPSSTAPAVASDGTIYVHTNGDEGNEVAIEKLYALRPDGTLKWLFKPNGDLGSFTSHIQSSPAIGADGSVYVGSMNTYFYAVDPNGTKKWSDSPSTSSITSSPAIAPDGTIYCLDAAATLRAYYPGGGIKWTLSLDTVSGGDGSPSIGPDGTIYVATSGSSKLHAVRPTGTVKWSKVIGSSCLATPAVTTGGTVYINDDGLYALGSDGTTRWKYGSDVLSSSVSPVISRDGTIYWREAWEFHAVTATGGKKWTIDLPSTDSAGLDPAPAIAADGTLYVPQPDVFDDSNQYLKAYFTRSACKVRMTLGGVRRGVLKYRRAFTAKGKVTSANLSATKAKLALQRKKGTKWVKVKIVSRTLSATKTYRWKYKPTRKGTYRIRATVAQTATNKAAATKWKTFKVR
jgi:hypothetical protein